MAGLRGAGKVYLSVNNSGTYTGYMDMANIASFTIGNEGANTVTLKSTAPSNYGSVIGSATTPGDDTITIALNVPNRKNLTVMLLGTDTAISNSGAALSAPGDYTVLGKDTYIPLLHRKIASTPAPVVTQGGSTKTATTDYVVDFSEGVLYIPAASTINAGTISIQYTHANYSGYKIDARTKSNINCKLLFVGENLDDSSKLRLIADSVELSPEGDFSLLSADGEFLEFTLSGTIKVPDGQTSPFTLENYS